MIRHVLGISGGKDSAALALYMKEKYPDFTLEYYNSDTGCELEETEQLIRELESVLGPITRLKAAEGSPELTPSFSKSKWWILTFATSSLVYSKDEIS